MRSHIGRSLAALLATAAVATAACGGARSAETAAAAGTQREGVFRFTERVANTSPSNIVLEGTVKVSADTVEFDMVPGPCRYAQPSEQSRTAFIYRCGDVHIRIDRNDPSRISYSLSTIITVSKQVCAEYAVQNGRRVCVRTEQQKEEERVGRSGRLRLIRIS
jgi:hypothetical protein